MTIFHLKANSSEQQGLDGEQRRNFLGSVQTNPPAQVPSAAEFLPHLGGSKEFLSFVFCLFAFCSIAGFVTRLLLARPGQLSLRVTIAEPVSTREIQNPGV